MAMASFHRIRQARNCEVSSGDDRHRRAQGIALERGTGIWNGQGTMDEEFLFWDNRTFYGEMGLS